MSKRVIERQALKNEQVGLYHNSLLLLLNHLYSIHYIEITSIFRDVIEIFQSKVDMVSQTYCQIRQNIDR